MGEIAYSKDSHNLKALTFIGNAKLKILDRSSFNLSSCDERLSVYVPRFVLLYNTLCKHSFLFCVAVKLDNLKERKRYVYDYVRNLESAAIFIENFAYNGRRRRSVNRR